MRESLATKSAEEFDLKQSAGGIVDIEFMVQFGVLANAANSSVLTIYTDNIRLLDSLQSACIISENEQKTLKMGIVLIVTWDINGFYKVIKQLSMLKSLSNCANK